MKDKEVIFFSYKPYKEEEVMPGRKLIFQQHFSTVKTEPNDTDQTLLHESHMFPVFSFRLDIFVFTEVIFWLLFFHFPICTSISSIGEQVSKLNIQQMMKLCTVCDQKAAVKCSWVFDGSSNCSEVACHEYRKR